MIHHHPRYRCNLQWQGCWLRAAGKHLYEAKILFGNKLL